MRYTDVKLDWAMSLAGAAGFAGGRMAWNLFWIEKADGPTALSERYWKV